MTNRNEYHRLAAPHERMGSQHFVKKMLTFIFSLAAVLLLIPAQGDAQNLPPTGEGGSSAPQRTPSEVQLSPSVAEKLLIHKEEPACQKDHPGGAKITGTVVISITIDNDGKVSRARSLSGPGMLRPLALAAVRKYLYKPYTVNYAPVVARTVVSVPIDCFFHAGRA